MRMALSLAVLVLVPTLALAEPPVKLYYVGEAKVSSADGKPMGSQVPDLQSSPWRHPQCCFLPEE